MSTTDMPPGVVSRKVYGAVGAGTIGTVTGDLVLGLLDDHYYDPSTPGSVPVYVTAFIVVLFSVVSTLAGGYFTKRGVDEVDTGQDEPLAVELVGGGGGQDVDVDTRPVRPVGPPPVAGGETGDH